MTAFQSNTFQQNAFQSGGGGNPTFFASGILLRTEEGSFSSDARFTTGIVTNTNSFTSDSLIVSPPVTFTANATFVTPEIFDDFNRASLGSDYANVNLLSIVSNELVAVAGTWGDLSRVTYVQPSPTTITFDFWVPPVDDGYHGYQVESAFVNAYLYVDNLGPTDWGLYIGTASYNFNPDLGSWYTAKGYFDRTSGSQWGAKVWKIGTPEPLSWQLTYNNPTLRAVGTSHYIYIDADGASHPSKMDNLSIDAGIHGAFRADAYMSDGGPIVVEGSFTADAVVVRHFSFEDFSSGVGGYVPQFLVGSYVTGNGYLESPPATQATFRHVDGFRAPNFVRFDFYSPPHVGSIPDFEIYQFHITAGGRLIAVEIGDDDEWFMAVGQSPAYTFAPLADTWYRVFAYIEDFAGGKVDVYIWPRDSQMPSSPTFTRTYSTAAGAVHQIRTFSANNNTYSTAVDNILVYTLGPYLRSATFTANAIKRRIENRTFTADAVFENPDATVVFGSFTADSSLFSIVTQTFTANARLLGPVSVALTADARFELPYFTFTANALLFRTYSSTLTANAVLVSRVNASFTANSVIYTQNIKLFTANAVIRKVQGFIEPAGPGGRIAKNTTMTVLQRRPIEFSAFIPPRIPDQEDEGDDGTGTPNCLPPCAPYGAGGDVNGWGAFKVSMTKCSECNLYFRSDSEYLGRGSAGLDSAEHCGYCGPHMRDNHVTKLWVRYPSIPSGKFVMRAKMTWGLNDPDYVSVRVFSVPNFPTTEQDGCETTSFDGQWYGGKLVGRFIFNNDAAINSYIVLGQQQYKYQIEPSEFVLDGNTLDSRIFRFELTDETIHYNAKFRAANLEWPGIQS